MELLYILPGMVVLLLLKGFFSGSEIALVNADRLKLHHKANQGHKGAKLALRLFHSPDVLLGTTLVGTNICTIILTTIGTILTIRYLGEHGDLYAFLIFTPLLLILGEIVPKSVYQQKADPLAPIVIYPLRMFSWLFSPIIFIFSRLARLAAWLAGSGKGKQNPFMTREKIRAVVEMADRGADVDVFDRDRIKRAIRFGDTTVGEAMIPVAEVTAISRSESTKYAIDLVRRHGYNRLPVFQSNISNVVGTVTLSTWDLMDRELLKRALDEFIKPAYYVSHYQPVEQLIPILRQRQDHMAIVIDEFGSAVGIITLEDILEEVVGEIDVGYDFEEYLQRPKRAFEVLGEDLYLMDSRLPISEVNELLNLDLSTKEFHTVGGLVMTRLRHIPTEDEFVLEAGYRFTVVEATRRGASKLRVEPEGLD
jgi:CBS domain containing-hemolysin-like protein